MDQKKVNIYLVGDAKAPLTNQWAAMTNDWSQVEALKKEVGIDATHKMIQVGPSRHKGGRK